MPSKEPQLGLYWGSEAFSVYEKAPDNSCLNQFTVNFNEDASSSSSQMVPNAIKLTALLQKSLRDKKITAKDVNLSLSPQDIIFRTFNIPWMQANEIKNVLEFEIKKYIPFKLEELSYSFHSTPIGSEDKKQLRIIFVAVRAETLTRYASMLNQAGFNIIFSEPSTFSLVRLLIKENMLDQQEKGIIIQSFPASGNIVIVDEGLPIFVRDFTLPMGIGENHDPQLRQARLFNEIKMSIDYFKRQFSNVELMKSICISAIEDKDFVDGLSKDINMPASKFDVKKVITNEKASSDIGLLNSLGILTEDTVESPPSFDLSHDPNKTVTRAGIVVKEPIDKKIIIKTAGICAGVLVCIFGLIFSIIGGDNKKIAKYIKKETRYKKFSIAKIESETKELKKKLKEYKKIRMETDFSTYLSQIPNILPEGTWLKDLKIEYKNNKISKRKRRSRKKKKVASQEEKMGLAISGYAFTDEPSAQIPLVSSIITNLKRDDAFSKAFPEVKILTAQTEKIEEHIVTYFKIANNTSSKK